MPALERIGAFRVERLLNRGGMAVIYLVVDEGGRKRVIKMSRPVQNPRQQQVFNAAIKKEAEILRRLDHPRIVKIFPFQIPAKRGTRLTFYIRSNEFSSKPWYILLEYLPGSTLDEYVKKYAPLDVFTATNIAGNIGLGVYYLHETARLVHKDLSPKNIVSRTVPEKEGRFDPVIIDFGAAAGAKRPTEVEVGALYIMSPERIEAIQGRTAPEVQQVVDKRKSDIWSLGVLLYYLLTGRYPFTARTSRRLTSQIMTQEPPSIQKINPEVTSELDEFIVVRMLAKRPEYRPSIGEVLRFLAPYGSVHHRNIGRNA